MLYNQNIYIHLILNDDIEVYSFKELQLAKDIVDFYLEDLNNPQDNTFRIHLVLENGTQVNTQQLNTKELNTISTWCLDCGLNFLP